MIATLILTVCLISAPARCHQEYIPSDTILCSITDIAEWLMEHPTYRLISWKCRTGRDA